MTYQGCQVHSSLPAVEPMSQEVGFRVFACAGVALLILLEIVDEPMNGSSYAQCATPQYLKTVQFLSVNLQL